MIRTLWIAALLAGTALTLSCNVNEYCLNCAKPHGDGGADDANDGGDGDASDASDAGACINTGPEVCDNKDNDCDGSIDEGPLPEIGDLCANQVGECSGAVKQCIAGHVVCSKVPTPEQCDGKDNDCNGLTDEGDPGGGASCGTNVGECVAGTMHCNVATHVVECQGAIGTVGGQPELCNNRDDDCDGMFDEDIVSPGPCGGGPFADPNAGACQQGSLVCTGGVFVCGGNPGPVGPSFELCDAIDQDCDGNPTNGYNLNTDPLNCGACGNVCTLAHAFAGCGGNPVACTIASCQLGFFNNDGLASTGCEYGPCQLNGAEVCNGADDNCNGFVDDGLIPPVGLCKSVGACSMGTTLTCNGAGGWKCNYNGAGVSKDANGDLIPETTCDGIDNDCDGRTDEGQPNLNAACDNGGTGDCRSTGTFICNTANLNGPAVCNLTVIGPGSSPETCDGRDNNCNGQTDEGASTGNLAGQDWVDIGNGKQMMQYEASHPDATLTGTGSATAVACSRRDVLPWINVTYPQAKAACTAIGARLCSEEEWHRSCSVVTPTTWPFALPAAGNVAQTIEAEDFTTNTFVTDAFSAAPANVAHAWVEDFTPGFSGISAMQAGPDVGSNITTNTSIAANAARLDYAFNVQKAATYRIWVLIYSPNANGNRVGVAFDGATIPANATGNGQLITTASNNAWQWVQAATTFALTAAPHTLNVYFVRDGVRIDAIHITDTATTPALPAAGKGGNWAFAVNPNTYAAGTCNDQNLNAANDDVAATRSLAGCRSLTGANPYDMSGNVKEWTLAHVPGQNPIRGGASNNTSDGISCPLNFTLANDAFFFPNIGFRCCR